jgi:hypothetical protein
LGTENVSDNRYIWGNQKVSDTCYILVTADNELATCGVTIFSQLCDHHEGDRSGGEGKEGDEHDHELVLLLEPKLPTILLDALHQQDKHNILQFKMTELHQECKVSTTQPSCKNSF